MDSIEIVVRAYADVKGLHGACVRNGKMKNGASLSLFVHGFNQRQGLFDFVDVGPGKESADNKIRGTYETHSWVLAGLMNRHRVSRFLC